MRTRTWIQVAAIASSLGLAGGALAADAGTTTTQMQSGMSAAGSIGGVIPGGSSLVGGSERIDNTNDVPLDETRFIYAPPDRHDDDANIIRVLPGDQDAVTTPDAGDVLDEAPDEPHELYRLPEERDTLSGAESMPAPAA